MPKVRPHRTVCWPWTGWVTQCGGGVGRMTHGKCTAWAPAVRHSAAGPAPTPAPDVSVTLPFA
eukprot:1254539-Rhodomonas_salina.2